ncbi:hydrogenase maturation protease [Leptolyngbya iicbica]|uniref:Hydrogenase maturation protease n=2 Tax=Cyanophyceae TaxID=3028117 RepID=A0A4Q7E683_9CYAN|nr:hydrogenase maturation protease [Leptolyngbya sp. LK]RZM77728.1 hydrogenase maturation protease [Leptolyngbya sp. LK]
MTTLVVGYGNTLRGDDGVGYQLADQVAAWELPNVRAIACHQLTPELAAAMAECDRVIFIDATLPHTQVDVTWRSLSPSDAPGLDAHRSDPADLLRLTAQLYDTVPLAYQLLLPTAAMDFSETLSAIAQAGFDTALSQLWDFLTAP